MKRLFGKIVFLFLLLGFISCKSWYVVTIETQKPAAVFMPGPVDGVVVVNNALPQPSGAGILLYVNNKQVDKEIALDMDTTLWDAVVTLAQSIEDKQFFNKLLIYEVALRNDDDGWLSTSPVSKEMRDSIFQDVGCNTIVTVDRLLFDIKESVSTASDSFYIDPGYTYLNIKCRASMVCSAYYSKKEKRLTSFVVQDSTLLNTFFQNDSLDIYKNIPNYVLKQTGRMLAEDAASYFTPGWEKADRIIYSSSNSRMRQADKYFSGHKWAQAQAIWKQLYNEKEAATSDKARLAMNIAVSYEMEDDLISAMEWAERTKNLYQQINSEKLEEEKQRTEKYVSVLTVRIQNNKMLDIQLQEF